MRHLGMLAGEPPRAGSDVRRHVLAAAHDGRVRQLLPLGSAVSRGTPVAHVRELRGDVLETLASPVDGWLGIHNTYGFVQAGEDVVIVFEAT